MRLETQRLLIRDWTEDDIEAGFTIYGDPEVTRYLGTTGEPSPSVEVFGNNLRQRIEAAKGQPMGFWAAELRDTRELIGGALLKPLPDNSDIEVGYHLGRKHWGNGYATEIATALVDYGFNQLGLHRIVGVTYPQNKASMRVLEKAGLDHKGKGKYGDIDVELFVIERQEPK